MSILRILIFFPLILIYFPIHAQIGGKHTYQFLNLVSSPKQAALGGKNITGYTFDPTSALYNPSTINQEMNNQLSLNYVNYLGDINYGTAAYAFKPFSKLGVFQTGVTYINYGSFDGYDEFGNETGSFSGSEVALSIGYAYNIPSSNFFVGANIKGITSKLESYTSFGAALDLGITYFDPEKEMIISAVLRNAGTQFKPYDEVYETLPLELNLGISQKFKDLPVRWHFTMENMQQWNLAFRNTARDETDLEGNVTKDNPGFFNNFLRHTVLGVELFPEGNLNFRLGYSFRRSEELRIIDQRSFAGLSGGIGIKIKKLRFSYSYARFNSTGGSSLFGLNIDLSGNKNS